MEWITGSGSNEVDIGKSMGGKTWQFVLFFFSDSLLVFRLKQFCVFSGFVPEMKLFSAAPSFKFTGKDRQAVEIPNSQRPYDFDKLKWDDGAISVQEAYSVIEKTMYPFKEVGNDNSITPSFWLLH